MKHSTEKLLKKMNENSKFAEKIFTQTENKKVIELAKEEGIELTLDNIVEANEIIKNAMEEFQEGELSEEELEDISGGLRFKLGKGKADISLNINININKKTINNTIENAIISAITFTYEKGIPFATEKSSPIVEDVIVYSRKKMR